MPLRARLKRARDFVQRSFHDIGSTSPRATQFPSTTEPHPSLPAPMPVGLATAPTSSDTAPQVKMAQWVALRSLDGALKKDSGKFAPLSAIIGELFTLLENHGATLGGNKNHLSLQRELEELFEDLEYVVTRESSTSMTTSMASICWAIQQEVNATREKLNRGDQAQRFADEQENEDISRALRRIEGHLQRFLLNVRLNTWKRLDEAGTMALLNTLNPSHSAMYNSPKAAKWRPGGCVPNTRVEVLAWARRWVNHGSSSVCWLNGMAGTGKTTISFSLCAELEESSTLAASFFCSRLFPECRDVTLIIPSIAYQLARFSQPFRSALAQILESDPDVHKRTLAIQFEALVSKPLFKVRDTLLANLVVVIDALDECDDQLAIGQLVDLILSKAHEQPIKFFISSRPEVEIYGRMMKSEDRCERLELHQLDRNTEQLEIKTYLQEALAPIQPSPEEIAILTERSGGLFIYAATIVRYVWCDNPGLNHRARLESVLKSVTNSKASRTGEIDQLYMGVLRLAFEDKHLATDEKQAMILVLHTIMCAREPLTKTALARLLGLDPAVIDTTLRMLRSILHSGRAETISTLHASLPDFLFDPTRSQEYHCDFAEHNRVIAEHCFRCIRDQINFNICDLGSSFVADRDVTELENRVQRTIPAELSYASRYWATHLSLCPSSHASSLAPLLEEFLTLRLLIWAEIMNLTRVIRVAVDAMRLAEDWAMINSRKLVELAHDAWRFVTTLASAPVSCSTPHIYTSMLSFWPKGSPIGVVYANRARGLVRLEGTAMSTQQSNLIATWSVAGDVTTASLSPDGLLVAVGSGKEILVLDAYTGHITTDPIIGHVGRVSALAFSPDCRALVSGAHDDTIRIWDVSTRRLLLDPIRGHAYVVTSVEFSPNGVFIASGSRDKTVRIWDFRTGELVLGPLVGHTGGVTSIRYSPDATCIVSGSRESIIVWSASTGDILIGPLPIASLSQVPVAFSPDGSSILSVSGESGICVWDSRTGDIILRALEGHQNFVTAAAFSPDGSAIASGSADGTLYLSDRKSGQLLAGPLLGHAGSVNFVTFFPNGRLIISSSSDNTVRVWDPRGGNAAPSSLEARTEPINSVAMSPDQSLIASGSSNNTISLWDTQEEPRNIQLLKGHTAPVLSVCFSPDGAFVVSGSVDATVRIWDVQSGKLLFSLVGHTDSVTSVAFSPEGRRIISGSHDHTLREWDAMTGHLIAAPFEGHVGPVTAAASSWDGTCIASASQDKTIKIWDAYTGQLISDIRGHSGPTTAVEFSPDGQRVISSSEDKTICVWSLDGQMILGPIEGHTAAVLTISLSADGNRIISGSADRTLRMWDAQSGKLLLGPLKAHTRAVTSVGFYPNGTCVFSGSDDGTVRVTDIQADKSV
ncbi:hypothetical protein FRC11_006339, partial [Ceratobasidium sp. 423]